MPTLEHLKAKFKEYQDAAVNCRANAQNQNNLAVANDGAAQAISAIIMEVAKEQEEKEGPIQSTETTAP